MNVRVTAALLVVLGLVAGYLLLFGVPRTEAPSAPVKPWFYAASMDDIEYIAIETGGRREAFALTEDGWVFEGADLIPVDIDRWGGITLLLSGPQTSRVLSEGVDDPARYGLDEPEIVINVGLRGDRQIDILLGDTTPNGDRYYAMQGGDANVYLVDSLWGGVLARLATEPPFPKWFYRTDPRRVTFLGVLKGEDKVQFTRDDAGWRSATPDRTPVDPVRWAEVLPILGGPPSLRVLQTRIETDEFARFGLDVPRAAILVEYNPPETIEGVRRSFEMEVGARTEDGSGYYAKVVGQPYLLFVGAPWFEVIERLVLEPPFIEAG